MYEIIDKILLFLCCLAVYLFQADSNYIIVPVIVSIVLSSLFVYYEDHRIRIAGIVFYAFLCLLLPGYLLFLPLLLYDVLHSREQYLFVLLPFLLAYHRNSYGGIIITVTILLLLISFLLKYKTDKLNSLHVEYNELRDNSAALSLLLEEKNQTLLNNQDYEINLATLNERNRISKEIHDNIGHLLSRSLLQVGAMLTISGEEIIREGLTDLKHSLSEGMDQVRNSIHNMYDESIDLYTQLEQLTKSFHFCPIQFEYDISSTPSLPFKHCILGITKEALANVMRHSNATKVSVLLREHPAMYQLVIQDNGTMDHNNKQRLQQLIQGQEFTDGMGLSNIIDRVKGFDGNINFLVDQGFKIFITIPKVQKNKTV